MNQSTFSGELKVREYYCYPGNLSLPHLCPFLMPELGDTAGED